MFATFIKYISTICFKLFHCRASIMESSIVVLSKIRCSKTNECIIRNSYIKKTGITISGDNNTCIVRSTLSDSSIMVSGCNNHIEIVCEDNVCSLKLQVFGNDCTVIIEKGTAINGANVVCMGNGTNVLIGKNCLFANHIDIWASDSHPIFKINSNDVINPSKDIILEDHVWVCEKSCILKGVRVGTNSVVGMAAVVTHDIPPFSIVAGNPARIIKNNITWSRPHIDS